MINFYKFEQILIRESQKDELKCPHPEDQEYCRQWKKFMNGEIDSLPVYTGKSSIGHYRGPRAGKIESKRDKKRKGDSQKGGRYDWRKD